MKHENDIANILADEECRNSFMEFSPYKIAEKIVEIEGDYRKAWETRP